MAITSLAQEMEAPRWRAHDMSRPKPPRIEPVPQDLPAPAPQGAVILFGGTDLSAWSSGDGEAARWRVEDDHFVVVPGTGTLRTREGFGDVQLHVEWAAPAEPEDSGQNRGNSGVLLMGGRYEVQVLDMHDNDTYADGQAAAVYGQYPPLYNASRPRGEWQAYDIFFRRPRFGTDGEVLEPARISVLHNGVLVQDNVELWGPTAWLRYLPYEPHADELPIELQDHGSPVRYRNIWALRLPEPPPPPENYAAGARAIKLTEGQIDRLTGTYHRTDDGSSITIIREGDKLLADFRWREGRLEMAPVSPTAFELTETAGRVVFDVEDDGAPMALVFELGGAEYPATRADAGQ